MKNLVLLSVILFAACASTQNKEAASLDIQGHRGARGLYPENTIEAFLRAIDIGVTTIEMDVVMSGDSQLVVSHEAFMNPAICFGADGKDIADSVNLYTIPYDSIAQFDCGSKPYARFPQQKKMKAVKPLLFEVIDTVEAYCKAKGLKTVNYNIETKSEPAGDGKFNPTPDVFASALWKMVQSKGIEKRTTIQSFDMRTLQWLHKQNVDVSMALLIENSANTDSCIAALGFTPTIYSPNFELINKDVVDKLHTKNIKVIPWTVNDDRDLRRVAEMGVDGIITDYPDRAVKLLTQPR